MSEFNEVARHGALKELNDKKQDSDDDIAEELSIEMSSGTSEEDEGLPEYTNVVPTTPKCLKFVVPFSSSYKSRFTTTGHIGMLNVWCPIQSEEEGNHLKSIVDHPLISFFIERYKRTSGFSPAVKNSMIPLLTSTVNVEDQFNLTGEEIEYLQSINVL